MKINHDADSPHECFHLTKSELFHHLRKLDLGSRNKKSEEIEAIANLEGITLEQKCLIAYIAGAARKDADHKMVKIKEMLDATMVKISKDLGVDVTSICGEADSMEDFMDKLRERS